MEYVLNARLDGTLGLMDDVLLLISIAEIGEIMENVFNVIMAIFSKMENVSEIHSSSFHLLIVYVQNGKAEFV